MATPTQPLLLNIADPERDGRLVAFDNEGSAGQSQLLIRHESPLLALRCVEPALPGSGRPWNDVDLEAARSAGGVRFGLGEFDKAPDSGDWPLSFNGSSTGLTSLASNISEADLKTALNANAAITSAGGIATVKQTGRTYRLTFTTVGAKADFTSGDNNLLPLSSVRITRVQAGTASRKEIVSITIKRRPYISCQSWTAAPAAAVTCVRNIAGSATDPKADCVQTITLTPGSYGGQWALPLVLPNKSTGDGATAVSRTIVLTATDDADAMLRKLQTHPEAVKDGATGIRVDGIAGGPYVLTFTEHLGSTTIAELAPANLGLLVPRTLKGYLSLNQDALINFFDGLSANTGSLQAELEIQFPGQDPTKPYQAIWTVGKDLWDTAALLPAPPSAYPLPGLIVQGRRDITALTGGAANALDGIVTATGNAPQFLIISAVGKSRVWELVQDATSPTENATDGPIKPDDYNASTNPYVWKPML